LYPTKTGIFNDDLERFRSGVGITPARTDQQGKPPSQRKYKILPPEYRFDIFNILLGFCTVFFYLGCALSDVPFVTGLGNKRGKEN
jgi:hypothetical protein